MKKRTRSNPTLLYPRLSVEEALEAWPELAEPFAHAAVFAALEIAGYPLDSEEVVRAMRASTSSPLVRLLKQCGTQECNLAAQTLKKTTRIKALVALAPVALTQYQQTLFAVWDSTLDARPMLRLLAYADRRAAVWCAAQIARDVLKFVPAGELRPLRAIEAAEAWTRGDASVEDVRAAAAAATDYAAYYYAYDASAAAAADSAAYYYAYADDSVNAAAYAYVYAADSVNATAYDVRNEALARFANLIRNCVQAPELIP